ncbi:pilus assembly protein TadG-related protein [uncultured Parvibaculum sp.]|uniref:pilus assembly protein TadG-related protein n=1 Tax=uncultured Parvibaculum sp. TaxID=291828 RepID=UPI0030D9495C
MRQSEATASKSPCRIGQRLAALRRDARGASAVTFALALPAIVGLGGLGLDAASWYSGKRQLQSATDYAALAGAIDRSASGGGSVAAHVGTVLARNGVDVGALEELTINAPPLQGAHAGDPDAVEVVAAERTHIVLSGLFVEEAPVVRARAVATITGAGLSCVLALSASASNAISFGGASIADLKGCGLASNSAHNRSIATTGAANIDAISVYSAGGVFGSGYSTTTGIKTDQEPLADPYGDIEVPSFSGCTANNLAVSGAVTLNPGVYCGGVAFNSGSNVWLNPGVYVMDRGDFDATSNATIRGNDVTIIFTSSTGSSYGTFAGHGGAMLELSAPTEGPFAGILMFGDRNVPASVDVSINGNQHSRFHGALYFPSQPISYSGNFTFPDGCIQLVAHTVTFGGSSSLSVPARCTDNSLRTIGTLSAVLVE